MEQNKILEDEMIILVDEDGTETSFELVATLEIEGKQYALLAENEASEDVMPFEITEGEDGEMSLTPVEDEDEFEKIAEAYDALFDEEEGCECGCDHHHED